MKKIFEGTFDEEVHSDFLKFGRGDYKDRYLIEGKKQSKIWAIKTGPEYVNFIVKKCLEKTSKEIHIKGIIVTTLDLKEDIDFEIGKISNFQGVKKIQIDTTTDPSKIIELMNKYPRVFFALSFSEENFSLKVKAKAPKSAKPGKESEEGPKADFCSLKTSDREIINELFFNIPDFKEASVNHTIKVEDIVYPNNVNELKPAEVREQSRRKGIIIRKVIVDGKETVNEAKFVA